MAEHDAEDKTEEATPRRQEQAREKGQVLRSRDFSVMATLVCASAYCIARGGVHTAQLVTWFSGQLDLSRERIWNETVMLTALADAGMHTIGLLLPFAVFLFVVLFVAGFSIGGWNISWEAVGFKGSRLNPLEGIKRIFSWNALMEILKSSLKMLLLVCTVIAYVYCHEQDVWYLVFFPYEQATGQAGSYLVHGFLWMSLALVCIVCLDVPFQWWSHTKKLRMSMQDIKDEHKDVEGKPEVKRKIREMQRAAAQRKMWDEIPQADVVITNPTHYAVAIRYLQTSDPAPVVVAKGRDLIAEQIKRIAAGHRVPVLSSPALARALYHHTPLDAPIPMGLYTAVAHVLAYIYALKRYERGYGQKPQRPEEWEVPEQLQKNDT